MALAVIRKTTLMSTLCIATEPTKTRESKNGAPTQEITLPTENTFGANLEASKDAVTTRLADLPAPTSIT